MTRADELATTGPATTGPATTGPASTGPATTGPATTGPATTGPATTGPATTGPATTGPASTGPATTGPATTGPASTGPASTGLASTIRPRKRARVQEKEKERERQVVVDSSSIRSPRRFMRINDLFRVIHDHTDDDEERQELYHVNQLVLAARHALELPNDVLSMLANENRYVVHLAELDASTGPASTGPASTGPASTGGVSVDRAAEYFARLKAILVELALTLDT